MRLSRRSRSDGVGHGAGVTGTLKLVLVLSYDMLVQHGLECRDNVHRCTFLLLDNTANEKTRQTNERANEQTIR